MKHASLGLGNSTRRTRKRQFLEEMERVVPCAPLVALIAPHMSAGERGRPPFPVEAMLRIHVMHQWFTLGDPVMEEALHDEPLFRDFAGLGGWDDRLPDEKTLLRFRHALGRYRPSSSCPPLPAHAGTDGSPASAIASSPSS
jgi:IS5 family transposase